MDVKAIVDGLNEKAKENIPFEAGDYVGENGLMFCGKCNSAKETVVNFLGNETKVRCLCNCGAERRDKEMLLINRAKSLVISLVRLIVYSVIPIRHYSSSSSSVPTEEKL